MNIMLAYINGRGKKVVKTFDEPMEVIGYIYRCWRAAMNAESSRRVKEKVDALFERERLENQENKLLAEGGAE